MTKIQHRVKLAATARGKTITGVAEEMGISRQYLREMLRGTRKLSAKRLESISHILGVTPEWIMGYESNREDLIGDFLDKNDEVMEKTGVSRSEIEAIIKILLKMGLSDRPEK